MSTTATGTKHFDKDLVKAAAAGHWGEIAVSETSIDPAVLDGRHHPCPVCAGTDRFNADRDDFDNTGRIFCKPDCVLNGSVFDAIMHYHSVNFNGALSIVADFLIRGGYATAEQLVNQSKHHGNGRRRCAIWRFAGTGTHRLVHRL